MSHTNLSKNKPNHSKTFTNILINTPNKNTYSSINQNPRKLNTMSPIPAPTPDIAHKSKIPITISPNK
jgi:hypothetical protein